MATEKYNEAASIVCKSAHLFNENHKSLFGHSIYSFRDLENDIAIEWRVFISTGDIYIIQFGTKEPGYLIMGVVATHATHINNK